MGFSTLSSWLSWILDIHYTEIELGLDRVQAVAARLNALSLPGIKIIVAGTNGKGSTVASLEAIYLSAGYRVGSFTSPILFSHNEQVRINGKPVADAAFCEAFAQIEAARAEISLTPFEFFTLAGLLIFEQHHLDVLLLEVGLGGRLDAVNIINADLAIVTSIDLDHTDRLGNTREAIAKEKAGIFRPNVPVVCGDPNPPQILRDCAVTLNAPFFCQGEAFTYHEQENNWQWRYQAKQETLPSNTLLTQNMAAVRMAVELLQAKLPASFAAISEGLATVQLPGRIQVVKGEITEIFDVAHNPAAVALLAKKLPKIAAHTGKTHAVFSMLADKDISSSITNICSHVDFWYSAPLQNKRAASKEQLTASFSAIELKQIKLFDSITSAYQTAKFTAKPGDRLLIFGSFHTVAEAWQAKMDIT